MHTKVTSICIIIMKISRSQYGLEEEIVQAIYSLKDKKSSDIFREPVDGNKIPDYYEKIKNPIDLSTILNKLKNHKYATANEVFDDLQLIVINCRKYNFYNQNIIRKADQFNDCIKTVWGNFKKELQRKKIFYDSPIEINDDIIKRINLLEEKKSKRRPPILFSTIQQDKRSTMSVTSVLPPLEIDNNKIEKQELPPKLQFKPETYSYLNREERSLFMSFKQLQTDAINSFEKLAVKKLKKYRKILKQRLFWFDKKIIDKCLKKKRFQKMIIPSHLKILLDNGAIAEELSIRKLQLYIKQITYWIEANSNILNDYMKDKFVENCRSTKKCILRVIKYRKIPKLRRILDAQIFGSDLPIDITDNQRQYDNYDNQMKQFRRNFERDQGDSTKRDTKIILRNQNGELQVIDWTSDKKQERIRKEGGGNARIEMVDTNEKRRIEERKREEMERDKQFIEEYRKKSNLLLVDKYAQKLCLNWNMVTNRDYQLPMQINFNEIYTQDDE